MLDSGHWQICEDCPKLIEQLPTLVRDPDNTEAIRKVDFSENGIGDDAYDGASMGLVFMCGSSFKPEEVRLREEALAIEDKEERFFWLYKKMHDMHSIQIKEKTLPSWAQRLVN